MHVFQKIDVPLQAILRNHPQNRDVAQLVAHYVRDVGVGRSSRLIPTAKSKGGRTVDHLCFFYSHPKDLLQALPDRQTD